MFNPEDTTNDEDTDGDIEIIYSDDDVDIDDLGDIWFPH